eukprot:gene5792-11694_t
MSSDLVIQVKQAYDALGAQVDNRKANEWLMDFERSPAAWEVAHLLLLEPRKSPYRFFGANILHNKIRQDIEQLQGDSPNDLKRVLINDLILMGNESDLEKSVCQRICLCVSALALQLNQNGIISEILSSLNSIISTSPIIILELLTVLPEECYDRRVYVHPNIRDTFALQLCQSIPDVFAFLNSMYQPNTTSDIKNQIICCLSRWIENIQLDEEFLASHILFNNILDSIQNPNQFDDVIDLIINTLRRFRYPSHPKLPLLPIILPRVLATRQLWSQQDILNNNHDDDVCRNLCRLYTETGETYCEILVTESNLQSQRTELFVQLIECVRFPWDFEISRIPLQFFYELSKLLSNENNNTNNNNNNQHSPTNTSTSTSTSTTSYSINDYIPLYSALLDIAITQMKLEGANIMGIDKMSEDKERQRFDLLDCITDCCSVIGGPLALQQICILLQKELEQVSLLQNQSKEVLPDQWCLLESCLTCITIVSKFLPSDENTVLPQLMRILPTLPNVPGVTIAVIEVIGKFASWINCHTEFMMPLFGQLLSFLPISITSEVSAKAIRLLCIGCASQPDLPIKEIHEQLLHHREASASANTGTTGSTGVLTLYADLDVLEGLCKAISMLPSPKTIEDALKHVVEPIARTLTASLENNSNSSLKSILADVDRLTVAFRFTTFSGDFNSTSNSTLTSTTSVHPVLSVFLLIWPLLRHVLSRFTTDNATERVCRCYKHIIRNAHEHFANEQCLPVMLGDILEYFSKTQNASFLYMGAICFSEFSKISNGKYIEQLYQMIWMFSETFFIKFKSLSDFEQRPDVVEEYFYLLAIALEFAPEPLVSSTQAGLFIQAGITGLRLHHREAQKGILLFFERIVSLTLNMKHDQKIQSVINPLLAQFAQEIVTALFYCLSGCLPAYAVDENQGSINDVLWALKKLTPEGLNVGLDFYEAKRLKIPDSLIYTEKRYDFNDIIRKFERQCRQRSNA